MTNGGRSLRTTLNGAQVRVARGPNRETLSHSCLLLALVLQVLMTGTQTCSCATPTHASSMGSV